MPIIIFFNAWPQGRGCYFSAYGGLRFKVISDHLFIFIFYFYKVPTPVTLAGRGQVPPPWVS